MNITVNVNVNAPELVEAISVLASAIAIGKKSNNPLLAEEKTVSFPAPTLTTSSVPTFTTQTAAPTPEQSPTPITAPMPITPVAQTPMNTPEQTPAQDPVSTVPTTAQTFTIEQLAVAATQLVDAGRRQELVNLLSSFGVQALTALPKAQYGAFATQLRAMGAKI